MADLQYVTKNRLTTESDDKVAQTRKYVFIAGFVVSALLALFIHPFAGGAAAVFTLFAALTVSGDASVRAGAAGEDNALHLLSQLGPNYTLFNQVDLPSSRSRTGVVEADMLVVGPRCLFVIEIKHNNGEISCEENREQWPVVKTGRGGTRYGKDMRNPIKQVKQQVWLLGEYLKSRNAKCWIQPVVVFTHPEASLAGRHGTSVPVLTAPELIPYLTRFSPENTRPVSSHTLAAISELKKA
jgi:hypothetical protein